MTRAIVTQLVDALENLCKVIIIDQKKKEQYHRATYAIEAAREYLATEPSGERAELINTPEKVREFFGSNFDSLRYAREDKEPDEGDKYTVSAHDIISAFDWSADMLEADAQQAKPYDQQSMNLCDTCGWKGVFPGEPCLVCAQQAKRVPMTMTERSAAWVAATIEMPSHENCYLRGMLDAESHHGITPAEKPTDWGQP